MKEKRGSDLGGEDSEYQMGSVLRPMPPETGGYNAEKRRTVAEE